MTDREESEAAAALRDAFTRPYLIYVPLRRRGWVRRGSPLWALMALVDGIRWLVVHTALLVGVADGIGSEIGGRPEQGSSTVEKLCAAMLDEVYLWGAAFVRGLASSIAILAAAFVLASLIALVSLPILLWIVALR